MGEDVSKLALGFPLAESRIMFVCSKDFMDISKSESSPIEIICAVVSGFCNSINKTFEQARDNIKLYPAVSESTTHKLSVVNVFFKIDS